MIRVPSVVLFVVTTVASLGLSGATVGGAAVDNECGAASRYAAARGDTRAQYNLGLCALRAARSEATDGDDAGAQVYGTSGNGRHSAGAQAERRARLEGEAERWLESSARQRNPPAEFQLGLLREEAGDVEGAARWFARAAVAGHAGAQRELGHLHRRGEGVAGGADPHEAARWFEAAAEQGDAEAAFLAGTVHGRTLKNVSAATVWFEKAARMGHVQAAVNLGTFYFHGMGVAADKRAALRWTRFAASMGHEGAAQNAERLAAEMAAEGGYGDDAEAAGPGGEGGEDSADELFERGMAYHKGRVPAEVDPVTNRAIVNRSRGVELFQKAADAGYTAALTQLCSMWLRGEVVAKDYRRAQECYRRAAEAGDAAAQYRTGLLLLEGPPRAAERSVESGRAWVIRAAEASNADARAIVAHWCRAGEVTGGLCGRAKGDA